MLLGGISIVFPSAFFLPLPLLLIGGEGGLSDGLLVCTSTIKRFGAGVKYIYSQHVQAVRAHVTVYSSTVYSSISVGFIVRVEEKTWVNLP